MKKCIDMHNIEKVLMNRSIFYSLLSNMNKYRTYIIPRVSAVVVLMGHQGAIVGIKTTTSGQIFLCIGPQMPLKQNRTVNGHSYLNH